MTTDVIFLAAALMLILSVAASRVSGILGVPSLLVFLAVGMLAGSDGPGGIAFDNYGLAFAVSSVALAFILFDGGMRTSWESVRPLLRTGVSLATIGVVVTAAATALFARYAFDLQWTSACLIGAMVSSTDAAAVFAVLRSRNLALKGRLKQVLEFEAGSNDPTAILLTVAVLAYAAPPGEAPPALFRLFAAQIVLGLGLGWAGGRLIALVVNRIGLEYEGLYSVLLLACVLLLFAGTSVLGGSAFLAVYVAGMTIGNARLLHKASLLKFHDGIAWIAQIVLFLTLGLLVYPTHLPEVWVEGMLLALFLMLVARPLSVLVAAPTRLFHWRERVFVSWVGLRGAAPIMLATLPWSMGLPGAEGLFNLVFFVVLLTVLVQGTTITWLARRLGLVGPLAPEPDAMAGVLPPGFVTVEMVVQPSAPAAMRRLFELGLRSGVLLTSIERDGRYVLPAGDTRFQPGDRVRAFARPSNVDALSETFGEVRVTS